MSAHRRRGGSRLIQVMADRLSRPQMGAGGKGACGQCANDDNAGQTGRVQFQIVRFLSCTHRQTLNKYTRAAFPPSADHQTTKERMSHYTIAPARSQTPVMNPTGFGYHYCGNPLLYAAAPGSGSRFQEGSLN